MKLIKLLSLLFFLSSIMLSAQSINKFDSAGKRDGVWKKNFESTDIIRYQGTFLHGKEVGEFKFYKNINGKAVLSATKVFNKENNIAKVTFLGSKGKIISEGEMDGKTFIGTWKYYQKSNDNLLILENFNNNGELIGDRFVYYKNGEIAEKQSYLAGKLNGESFWYSENNVVLKSFVYENDEIHGPSKIYNGKGELLIEGQYKRDKKDGVWKYYENGALKEEKDFTYVPKYVKK
ncbi:toxin-antitoxin system YwqK family antitoxin [Algibacter sp. L4_22]|uniref:toxin-antitoxin system YwqK family antitoxin n=1 Tax=Algibacter sp. L4_22 TaxID=2942477 RepID=UPI00201B7C53|nr:toxin-antitoxin system YwqK family antitoxin [Algibacter sp. L4_22]MCL5128091.1 toxin-antitoxin system YwqK family antitoxin [Algibacter sp. L4_22]